MLNGSRDRIVTWAEFKEIAKANGVTEYKDTVLVNEEELEFHNLERWHGDDLRVVSLPSHLDDDMVAPTQLRNLCVGLGISPSLCGHFVAVEIQG